MHLMGTGFILVDPQGFEPGVGLVASALTMISEWNRIVRGAMNQKLLL